MANETTGIRRIPDHVLRRWITELAPVARPEEELDRIILQRLSTEELIQAMDSLVGNLSGRPARPNQTAGVWPRKEG